MSCVPATSFGAAPLVIVRPAAEAGVDYRYEYYWELLDRALHVTQPDFGDYEIKQTSAPVDEQRALADLESGTGAEDILVHGNVRDYESHLLPLRIPLDKGLLGYRVFLIRANMQPEFDRINRLEDLRKYRIGQGRQWGDIEILRNAGLTVVEGGGYAGLFKMLAANRFDLFSRSVTEILEELDRNRDITPPLAIEQHLLLHYPLTRYFYFSRSPRGELIKTRVQAGLDRMRVDGSFDQLFNHYLSAIAGPIGLRSRLLFRISNPLLTDETPIEQKDLWYDPLKG